MNIFMMIYKNQQWIKDIDETLTVLPELEELAGKTIMITGATGLICSAVVDVLFRYNDTHDTPIFIIAAGRSPERIRARFGEMVDRSDFKFILFDAVKPSSDIHTKCDYIIHGAGNAFPEAIMREPVETMLSNFLGTEYLLDYAKEHKVSRFLYISSSEIYGKKEGNYPYSEDDYGYIDLLKPRSSYPIGKRAAETLCASFADEYGVDSVIVRPGHIYGPTASPQDNRVSSAWALTVAQGGDIIMKSDGRQLRSYCYCLDCVSAIVKVLVHGVSTRAYNISNPDSTITIKELAELLAKTAGVRLVQMNASKEEKKSFNPMENSLLDSSSLQGLGWRGLFGAERGISHTVSILKDIALSSFF